MTSTPPGTGSTTGLDIRIASLEARMLVLESRPPTAAQSGFLPVRTVPVLGLVLHVLLGLEPRTALPGTRAGGTSTVPVLAVLYLKWRISLILINLRFIFFESHLLLVNIDS